MPAISFSTPSKVRGYTRKGREESKKERKRRGKEEREERRKEQETRINVH
jgi:hypothetical protein